MERYVKADWESRDQLLSNSRPVPNDLCSTALNRHSTVKIVFAGVSLFFSLVRIVHKNDHRDAISLLYTHRFHFAFLIPHVYVRMV